MNHRPHFFIRLLSAIAVLLIASGSVFAATRYAYTHPEIAGCYNAPSSKFQPASQPRLRSLPPDDAWIVHDAPAQVRLRIGRNEGSTELDPRIDGITFTVSPLVHYVGVFDRCGRESVAVELSAELHLSFSDLDASFPDQFWSGSLTQRIQPTVKWVVASLEVSPGQISPYPSDRATLVLPVRVLMRDARLLPAPSWLVLSDAYDTGQPHAWQVT
ncbi:MAG: hypothetical protein DCC49_07785 [Acidobacteria bacterium]|nr:MAG: hypothetical protein DCC49_07785 [Acidobacteriota bacterium]